MISEAGLQWSMNKLLSACNVFGLIISTQKMQVMCQPASHSMWPNPWITVKGNCLALSKNVMIDNEVNYKLAKASISFGRLSKNIWEHEGLSAHTKLKVYKAVVLSTLLWACDSWTVYSRKLKSRNSTRFYLNCLCRLLHICWWHRIPDTEVTLMSS